METAVEAGALKSNPTKGVKVTGSSEREILFLTAEQVARLADEAESRRAGSGTLVLLLAYGGLRWGEAAALRRGRCDLLRSRILIKESVAEVNGELHYGTTKTHQDRVIVLPGMIRDQLAAHIAEHVDDDPEALVFPDAKGGALRNSNWRVRVFQPAAEASGMPENLRVHDLRHTAASLLVSAGANLKAVQRHLGHASASMTLDRYSRLFTDDLEALAERLDLVISDANASSARPGATSEVVELSA